MGSQRGLPPRPRGGGGGGGGSGGRGATTTAAAANTERDIGIDDAVRSPDDAAPPFSQLMHAGADDAMGMGFSCTGFDEATGAPVFDAARRRASAGTAAAAVTTTTHVVADYDNNSSGLGGRRRGKVFNDPIHGHFYLSPLEVAVVDTPAFQRLRDLKQLGTSYFVFPGACHNRFEHSLGVAHLAREHADRVWRLQRSEVDVERGDVKAVALAGLCHDLGHGPFSHVFERELLARRGVAGWCHEDMSVRVFDSILDSGAVPDGALSEGEAARVRDIILAGHHSSSSGSRGEGGGNNNDENNDDALFSTPTGTQNTQNDNGRSFPEGKRWLHELVANGRNGLDVDKFDYLQRDAQHTGCRIAADFNRLQAFSKVIGDETCYKWSEYQNVHEVFRARASLHQRVYTHRKAKAVEYMVVDALLAAEPALRLAERARDVESFVTLDDTVLRQVETWWSTRRKKRSCFSSGGGEDDDDDDVDDDVQKAIEESQGILRRLRTRDLYRFCDEFVVPAADAASFTLPTPEQVACCLPSSAASSLPPDCRGKLDPKDVIVCEIPIDLTAGTANPLDRVSFFHHAGSTTKFRMRREDVSSMLPDVCAERKVRAYCRRTDDPAVAAAVTAAFGSWRARRFGSKVGSSTPQRAMMAMSGGGGGTGGTGGGTGGGRGAGGANATAVAAAPWGIDAAIAARMGSGSSPPCCGDDDDGAAGAGAGAGAGATAAAATTNGHGINGGEVKKRRLDL